MAGIAGITNQGETELVTKMLDKISYRGYTQPLIIQDERMTIGMITNSPQSIKPPPSIKKSVVWDDPRPPLPFAEQIQLCPNAFSLASVDQNDLVIARDSLGIRPLYFGHNQEGDLCFASEVKALLEATRDVHEFPPGAWMDSEKNIHKFNEIKLKPHENLPVEVMASNLRLLLEQSILRRIDDPMMGSWLSGGLDSSAIAALVRPHLKTLHTFVGGLKGAPDLEYARQVSDYLHTDHHEVIVTVEDLIKILPEVIYHMESFDALLIRSTLMNYLVAKLASQYVGSAFSGEGGDELFGGYDYLKNIPMQNLPAELVDITGRLHNTALQRVDRSASAHGLVIYVPLLDKDVVNFAFRTPPEMKIKHGLGGKIEKYIFRLSMQGALPDSILWRTKSKFWEGAGVETQLEQYAQEIISESDFNRESILSNGWKINTREEMMYYLIFKEQFGVFEDMTWMGRTKSAPVS